jgi:hypothetical protein
VTCVNFTHSQIGFVFSTTPTGKLRISSHFAFLLLTLPKIGFVFSFPTGWFISITIFQLILYVILSFRKLALFFQIASPEKFRIYSRFCFIPFVFSFLSSNINHSSIINNHLVRYYTKLYPKDQPNFKKISMKRHLLFVAHNTSNGILLLS